MPKRKLPKRNKKQIAYREGLPTSPDMPPLRSIFRSKGFRFVVGFILSCTGIYASILALPARYAVLINEHTAQALGLTLNLIGIHALVAGDIVTGRAFALQIIPECTPIFMVGLFLCFIIFSPATIRQKATGLLMGIPVLYFGNIVRLIAIFMTGQHDRSLFEVVHAFWGQVFTIFLVLMSFILWLKSLDKEESKRGISVEVARFLVRFALIAGCLFFVWMNVHHGYIEFLDRFMLFGFSLFGHHFEPARNTPVYYETFSIVTFTSLVLAFRSTPWTTRIKQLAAGLGFLFLTHLFHRIDNYLMVLFNYTAAVTIDFTLLLVGQYLLPVLLLIYSIRRQSKKSSLNHAASFIIA